MIKPTRPALLIALLLSAATLAAFWPLLQNGFVNYEDTLYITQNPHVLGGLTLGNVGWAFGTAYYDYWHPLAWVSHMVDMELFGLNPGWHHLTSLLIHVANTLLLFWVLSRMTGAVWRSGFVAALFALHPLHVESVAWVTERKDVLSTFFFMLTLLAYAKYAAGGWRLVGRGASHKGEPRTNNQHPTSNIQHPIPDAQHPASGIRHPASSIQHQVSNNTLHVSRFTFHVSRFYVLALLCFALGLMSKPMLVTVPCVLLLLDYWPLGRFPRLGSGVPSPGGQGPQPTEGDSGTARKSYIVNRIWSLLWEKAPFAVLTVVASAATYLVQRRVGAMDTLASVGFGERLANAVVSYMRYLGKMMWPSRVAVFYPHPLTLPVWEWAAAGAALGGLTLAAVWLGRSRRYVLTGWLWFLGTLVPVIGLVQVGEQAIADRYTYVSLIGLFIILVWGAFDIAARWRGGVPVAATAGVLALVALGARAHAQAAYWRTSATLFAHAIAVTENNAVAHNNLGTALADEGDWVEAGKHFAEALRLRPGLQMARVNCALALAHQDRTDEAVREIADVTQAVGAAGHRALGDVFREQGNAAEASQQYAAAVRLDPKDALARENLGLMLARQGKAAEASAQFAELARIRPDAQSQYYLALSLAVERKAKLAEEHYREAIRLKPDWPEPVNDLAWMLATFPRAEFRDAAEAVRLAEHACELTGHKEARFLGTLDAAYAEAGRFGEAITVAEEARKLALAAGDQALADGAAGRLLQYRAGKPYHEQH